MPSAGEDIRQLPGTGTPGTFNYRRAVQEWCFVQLPLMTLAAFRRAAHQRAFTFSTLSDPWEQLDSTGALMPVGYAHGHDVRHGGPGTLDSGRLVLREEVGYQPWDETPHGPVYAHWQLLSLGALHDHLTNAYPLDWMSRGADAFCERSIHAASHAVSPESLASLAGANRWLELVLARTQTFLMPLIRGGKYNGSWITGLTDDASVWTIQERQEFDFVQATADCDLTPGDLATLYERLAWHAVQRDGLQKWFVLVDQISRDRREEISGHDRRVLDMYDSARLVRAWHNWTGEDALPDVDSFRGIGSLEDVHKRLYGHRKIRRNRAALPHILERFDLYPWRVQLIAEGPSDIAMLEALLEALFQFDFAHHGVIAEHIGGASVPKKAEHLLALLKPYANYLLLIFDNEGNARRLVDELKRRRVLRADPEVKIWDQDVENDNFDTDEIAAVLHAHARRHDVAAFDLSAADIERETDRGKALGTAALLAAEQAGLVLSKPQLGALLGVYAAEHPEKDGLKRPIVDLAELVIRMSWATRRREWTDDDG